MSAGTSAEAPAPRAFGGSSGGHHHHDPRELWPRDFGRDGVSGLLTLDRAMRARDVSTPTPDDERMAAEVVAGLLARVDGRRPNGQAQRLRS